MRIEYIEMVCSSPQCRLRGEEEWIIRDHTPFTNPISRLITANATQKHCACGAPVIEREVRADGSVLELHPDGVMNEVSPDGAVECVGKIKL